MSTLQLTDTFESENKFYLKEVAVDGVSVRVTVRVTASVTQTSSPSFSLLRLRHAIAPISIVSPLFKRCRLHFLSFTPGACYDIMTVGAFTAFAQKYKHGGLRRQLRQLYATLNHTSDGNTILVNVTALLNRISAMRTAVNSYCEAVCRAAIHGDSADMNNSKTALCDKVRYRWLLFQEHHDEYSNLGWYEQLKNGALRLGPLTVITISVAPWIYKYYNLGWYEKFENGSVRFGRYL